MRLLVRLTGIVVNLDPLGGGKLFYLWRCYNTINKFIYLNHMYFVYLLMGWLIGLAITSFTLVPIMIIFFFGIPTTRRLTKDGTLQVGNPIIKNYFISVLILGLIFAGAWWVISNFFPSLLVGFWIGAVISVFLGLGKSGANDNNLSDYLETNKKYISTPSH